MVLVRLRENFVTYSVYKVLPYCASRAAAACNKLAVATVATVDVAATAATAAAPPSAIAAARTAVSSELSAALIPEASYLHLTPRLKSAKRASAHFCTIGHEYKSWRGSPFGGSRRFNASEAAAARKLNASICTARDADALLSIIQSHCSAFNSVHCATALHRYARNPGPQPDCRGTGPSMPVDKAWRSIGSSSQTPDRARCSAHLYTSRTPVIRGMEHICTLL
eukprot:6187679-Pleurochrysis_carterae.AAC.1